MGMSPKNRGLPQNFSGDDNWCANSNSKLCLFQKKCVGASIFFGQPKPHFFHGHAAWLSAFRPCSSLSETSRVPAWPWRRSNSNRWLSWRRGFRRKCWWGGEGKVGGTSWNWIFCAWLLAKKNPDDVRLIYVRLNRVTICNWLRNDRWKTKKLTMENPTKAGSDWYLT